MQELENLHFVKLPKKTAMKGFSPCIGKKIIVVCNNWGLFVPAHDYLFNQKTCQDKDFPTEALTIL